MTNVQEEWTMGELEDVDIEELARRIREGCISGRLDNGKGQHIYFELKYNVWQDE